jgi:hypothetical protein
MNARPRRAQSVRQSRRRKAYRSPKLSAYGDVRQLTDAASVNHPNADGGGGYVTKT